MSVFTKDGLVRANALKATIAALTQWPDKSVAAAVGNAWQENLCRTTTPGAKDHGSDGLWQWRLERLQELKNEYPGTWDTVPAQVEFMLMEVKRDYPSLLKDLTDGTKSIETLTANFCYDYERPAAIAADLDKRIAAAQEILGVAAPTIGDSMFSLPTWLSPGLVTGILSALGTVSDVAGHPALGTFISDPRTATTATAVVSGVAALIAGILRGVK